MKVQKLQNIERKEMLISYRRVYTAEAVLSIGNNGSSTQGPIEFALENTALGPVQVTVSILSSIDYPLVPAIRVLKDHITQLEKDGKLP